MLLSTSSRVKVFDLYYQTGYTSTNILERLIPLGNQYTVGEQVEISLGSKGVQQWVEATIIDPEFYDGSFLERILLLSPWRLVKVSDGNDHFSGRYLVGDKRIRKQSPQQNSGIRG